MNPVYFTGAAILAALICIFGLILSLSLPPRHKGEVDQIHSKALRKHRVLLNFHFLVFLFFAFFMMIVIGYVAWLFKS